MGWIRPCKYTLNVIDVASRYKGSYQLTTKNAKEVAQAFLWIYENTPLTYPKTLIIDDGKEFYGDVTKLMEKHDVMIQRGDPSQHRSQGIIERFNRTLADRLFNYQRVFSGGMYLAYSTFPRIINICFKTKE